jgi:hypothetical protein
MEQEIAAQLAAALKQYDRRCTEMVRTWLDMELYTEVSATVDEMRAHCEGVSRLSVPWVAFLISHSELVFCLWREGSGNSRCPDVQACVRSHSVALRHLRQCCASLVHLEQGGQAPPLPAAPG